MLPVIEAHSALSAALSSVLFSTALPPRECAGEEGEEEKHQSEGKGQEEERKQAGKEREQWERKMGNVKTHCLFQ